MDIKLKNDKVYLKDEAIKAINTLLNNCMSNDSKSKKAMLISYWLKDYCKYIEYEDTFEPQRLKRYERGDIIKVNFGFNVGSEYGGLHYAVVIDNKNAINSPTITVIPLKSFKDNDKMHNNDVYLGKKIYEQLLSRTKKQLDTIVSGVEKLKRERESNKEVLTLALNLKDYTEGDEQEEIALKEEIALQMKRITNENNLKIENLKGQEKQLRKRINELNKMNQGSIAIVNQITTISKQRIFDPKNNDGVLNGIKLSSSDLDKINEKIKMLYIY